MTKCYAFFQLTRPVNLALLALTQLLIKFIFLEAIAIPFAMDTAQYSLFVLACVCIAAGGNVINDIYDVAIDRINRPERVIVGKQLSEQATLYFYMALTIVGVVLGFVVANQVGYPKLSAVFILCAALLYFYASFGKSILVLNNIWIAALVAFGVLIVLIFDVYPMLQTPPKETYLEASKWIFQYAVFAFLLNWIREIVKDVEDINGDRNGGINTLPIALGRSRVLSIIFIMGVGLTFLVLYYTYVNLYQYPLISGYFLLAIVAPLIYFCIRAWQAEQPKQYRFLSLLLKGIMLSGVLSLFLLKQLL
ncbi:geranylgeranylglycerol-phosphate geranylgeranyltransferase [Altibacter sp. HG106]|uniref:geranylgeranylglycerol-phosphate geranylgeranyltransferase n=1 Tax=Altibacter sp. HG106 TaxID=3023937 RepID=UPI0023503C3C|nr:geranylgeranylglycerol-phosphate geranylgeranyltransferase [Altibacter sp. HG106]MDC7993695.1 geranylgeranylglycerol-phosphate geranylgeranyltransferase [Altibacter sp. HG106]